MRKGIFISFEGPEGGGKTTQARLLIERLEQEGREVLYTREPGGTPTGEAIRDILQYDKSGEAIADETEVLLFAASRAQLVRHVVVPALEAGQCVVCDRYVDSTTAYQGYGRGFPLEQITAINRFATADTLPDLTLLLDLEVAEGMARLQGRHQSQSTTYDRIEREEQAFHEKVRQGYLALAQGEPDRFRVFNAAQSAEALAAEVWSEVRHVLR